MKMYSKTKKILSIFMSVLMLMTCMSQLAFADSADLTDTIGTGWSLEGDANDLYTVAVEGDAITLTAPEIEEGEEGEEPVVPAKSVLQYNFADKTEGKYTISTRINLAENGRYALNVLDSDGNIVAGFGQVRESSKRSLIRVGSEEKRIYTQAQPDWYNVAITVDMDADTVDFSINMESSAYMQARILNGYFVIDEADAKTIYTQQSIPVEGGIKDIAVLQFDAPLNAWPMQIDTDVTIEEVVEEEGEEEEQNNILTAYGTATYADGAWDKTLQEIGFPESGYEILTTNASVNGLVSGTGTFSAATITTSYDATAGEIVDFVKTGTAKGATLAIKRDLSGLHADTDTVSVKTGFYTGDDFTAASTSAGYLAEVASSEGIIAAIWANSATGDILFKRQGMPTGIGEYEILDTASLIANTWYDVEYVLYGATGAMDLLISWPIPAESLADTDAYLAGLSLTATPASTTVTPSAADGIATLKFEYTGSLGRINNSLSDLYAVIGAYSDGGPTASSPSKMKVVTCTADETEEEEEPENTNVATSASETTTFDKTAQDIGLDANYTLLRKNGDTGSNEVTVSYAEGIIDIRRNSGSGMNKNDVMGVERTVRDLMETTGTEEGEIHITTGFYNGPTVQSSFDNDSYGACSRIKIHPFNDKNAAWVYVNEYGNIVMAGQGNSAGFTAMSKADGSYALEADTWYDVDLLLACNADNGTATFDISWDVPESFEGTDAEYVAQFVMGTAVTNYETPVLVCTEGRATLTLACTVTNLSYGDVNSSGARGISLTSSATKLGNAICPAKFKAINYSEEEENGIIFDSTYKLNSTGVFNIGADPYFTVTNKTGVPTDICVMMAAYKADGTLVQLSYREYTDLVDTMLLGYSVKIDISRLETGDYWKAFVFDSLNGMKPLGESLTREK